MLQQLTLKVVGPQDTISKFIMRAKEDYLVVQTSRIIEHQEDELAHVYLTLVEADQ